MTMTIQPGERLSTGLLAVQVHFPAWRTSLTRTGHAVADGPNGTHLEAPTAARLEQEIASYEFTHAPGFAGMTITQAITQQREVVASLLDLVAELGDGTKTWEDWDPTLTCTDRTSAARDGAAQELKAELDLLEYLERWLAIINQPCGAAA